MRGPADLYMLTFVAMVIAVPDSSSSCIIIAIDIDIVRALMVSSISAR